MKIIDYYNSKEEFELKKSNQLEELLRTYPLLDSKELDKYYIGDYISHENKKLTLFEKIYDLAQKYNQREKLKIIQKNTKEINTILDYGCGKGDFVKYLNDKGYNSFGFEPGEQARNNFLKQNNKKQLVDKIENKYDVITLFHVLEHIPNFVDIFEKLKNSLNDKGIIILALPNYKSYDAQFYKKYWAAYDVPRHQWHFSQKSINALVDKFGMIIVKKYPMILDSFYVSMISEKYKKSGVLGKIRGINIGLLSNIKALLSGEYSSIMYVIKK